MQEPRVRLASAFRRLLGFSGFHSGHVSTRHGRLHVYDSDPAGRSGKPTLVLVHGIGSNGQSFAPLGHMLRAHARIVIPDLLHFAGFSEAETTENTIRVHSECLVDLLETLGPDPVDLGGLSLGGWLSFHAARMAPGRIRKLVLFNPAGPALEPRELQKRVLSLDRASFPDFYRGLARGWIFSGTPLISAFARRTLFALLTHPQVKRFVEKVTEADFIDGFVREITAPTLLLWGSEDRFLPRGIPGFLLRELPDVRGYWVRGCAHLVSLEALADSYLSLVSFLGYDLAGTPPAVRAALKLLPRYDLIPMRAGDPNDGV